jgi:hypothetical protein
MSPRPPVRLPPPPDPVAPRGGVAARWRALEDRVLVPLAELEARARRQWRPGIRYAPTRGLRETLRLVAGVFIVSAAALALPAPLRRAFYLFLFFGVVLGGLWVAWRDNRDGPR